jgi:hypothetical protein
MKQVFLSTLLVDAISCILFITLLAAAGRADSFIIALYGAIMAFGNALVPTLICVLFFKSINNKTTLTNRASTKLFQTTILLIVFTSGIYLWSAIDVATFYWDLSKITLLEIEKDFQSQFSGYLPILCIHALIIPMVYEYLNE